MSVNFRTEQRGDKEEWMIMGNYLENHQIRHQIILDVVRVVTLFPNNVIL